MILRAALLATAAAVFSGCALGPPERLTRADEISPECAYAAEVLPGGISLEVVKIHRTFIPDAEGAVLAGRRCFVGVAGMLAARQGRQIVPPAVADMAATSQRDMGGAQTVHVVGRVAFQP